MTVELLAITLGAEKLIEEAGRTCYLSHDRAKEGSQAQFILSLIRRGHESVLEHASATFRVKGASRAFTHQLVRHRLCSFSQQSQRYVEETGFQSVIPPSIEANPEALRIFEEHLSRTQETYQRLRALGIPKEDARFVLPNAAVSEIVVSANFRQWRHILKLRGHKSAQWEIRSFAVQVARLLKEHAPACFSDFCIHETEIETTDQRG
ncbi:MAG: FAD-dependent thymidylate synthase [bacterium]